MKIQSKAFLLVLVSIALPVRAQFIDTFTPSDPSNYTEVLAYAAPASTGVPPTFTVNGSGQLQPTGGTVETAIFLRQGSALSDTIFDQSVSLSLVNVSTLGGAASIGFSNSLTPTSATPGSGYSSQDFEWGVVENAGSYWVSASNISGVANASTYKLSVNFSLGAVTDKVTRTADNTFAFEFSGPGFLGVYSGATLIPGPFSGTFSVAGSIATGKTLYFGPDIYGGPVGATGAQIVDNLQYVPEPSTYALMAAGLTVIALGGWRKLARG